MVPDDLEPLAVVPRALLGRDDLGVALLVGGRRELRACATGGFGRSVAEGNGLDRLRSRKLLSRSSVSSSRADWREPG